MILLDFSYLSYRNLYTAINNAHPKKDKDGKYITDDWYPLFVSQMLFSLNKIERNYRLKYGDIIIVLDSHKNWRKEYLEHHFYKGDRKKNREDSPINFNEFFENNNEFIEFLKNGIGYKTIQVENVEADDIGYILSKIINEKTLIVTEDKDWKQHLIDNFNVDMYMPLKDILLKNSEELQKELKLFKKVHILIGDIADGIPSIMKDIEFTPEFIHFLSENGITKNLVSELEQMDIYPELLEKAREKDIDIFKKARFGEKTAEKFIKDPQTFFNKIKDKKKLNENIKRNKLLIDIDNLPEEYIKSIKEEWEKEKDKNILNNNIIKDFINKHNLLKATNLSLNGKDLSGIHINNHFDNMFNF